MRPIILPFTLLASALTLPLPANADAIDRFTFNFDTTDGYLPVHVTMDLPASPPPSPFDFICGGNCFVVFSESSPTYIFEFSPFVSDSTLVRFALYSGGSLPVDRAYTQILASEDLFTGSLSDPTFILGNFDGVYRPTAGSPNFPGTIMIEPIDTAVPEPSTLATMATGILGAIAVLRSRKSGVRSKKPECR
jgi:hypothetical protein